MPRCSVACGALLLACTPLGVQSSVTANCPKIKYTCGRSLGTYIGPAPRQEDTKEACMTACLLEGRCQGIWFREQEKQCYLLDRKASDGAFVRWYDEWVADRPEFVHFACKSITPSRLDASSDSTCTGGDGFDDMCEAMAMECGAVDLAGNAGNIHRQRTAATARMCVKYCADEGEDCKAIHIDSLGGTCTMFAEHLDELGDVSLGSGGTRGLTWDRPAGLSECAKVAEPSGWTCSDPCDSVATADMAFGTVVLPQYTAPLWRTANNVGSLHACAALCTAFDGAGVALQQASAFVENIAQTRCRSVEYHEGSGLCTLFAASKSALAVDSSAGDAIVADVPDTTGNSKCLDFGALPSPGACPPGWTQRAATDVCYKLFGDGSSAARRLDVYGSSHVAAHHPRKKRDAERVCASQGGVLAWALDQDMNDFLVTNLLGHGGSSWVNVVRSQRTYAGGRGGSPSIPETQYTLPDKTTAPWTNFQSKRSGRGGGDCVVLQKERQAVGATGGVGKWDEMHCDAVYPFICERHSSPLAINTSDSGGTPTPMRTLQIGVENTIDLFGENFYAQVLVTLQTAKEDYHTAPANTATACAAVKDLTGVAAPLAVTVVSGTHAQVTVPSNYNLKLDAVYSLCFAEQRPHPSLPSEPSQFERYTGIDFRAVYTDYDRKADKCATRTTQVSGVVAATPGSGP